MCAVIGAVIKSPSHKDFENLKRVFLESKIRGMHATGVAFIKNGKVHIDKKPVPADQFPFDFSSYVNEDGNLYLVGHCRYSTSDLEYNQPIGNDNVAIVHNGVITQELPENWKAKYGYDCETKNDSELVLHSDSPLEEFSNMSMAVCELDATKKELLTYRNGKRPLYLTTMSNGSIITSTADIPKRAGLFFPTMEVPMNVYVTFDSALTMSLNRLDIKAVDYQHENISN
jgi:glutamine phosphoribosylpyrophosphate amidotransferase